MSPDFISTVTESVTEEVNEWQGRPLEKLYTVAKWKAPSPAWKTAANQFAIHYPERFVMQK